jgi:hypothetical protein
LLISFKQRLELAQARVFAVACQEDGMGSFFNDSAGFQQNDAIRKTHGRQAMCDNHGRAPGRR